MVLREDGQLTKRIQKIIPPQPGFKPINWFHGSSRQNGLTNLPRLQPTRQWQRNQQSERAAVLVRNVAIVPTTNPSEKACPSCFEKGQKNGMGRLRPLHCLGLVSFHFLLAESCAQLRMGRKFGKVFIHKRQSCIAQKTVGGSIDGSMGSAWWRNTSHRVKAFCETHGQHSIRSGH